MVAEACARGHQVSQDHIFLEANEEIALACNGSLSQHLGGLLERSRGDEGIRGERRLGHAQQQSVACGRLAPIATHGLVGDTECMPVHDGTRQEGSITRVSDLHLAHHLREDDFNVLIVDDHRLAAVDVLDFAQQILLGSFFATNPEDVVRIKRTVHQRLASFNLVTLVNPEVLALGHSVLGFLDDLAVLTLGLHNDRALAALTITEFHLTFDLTHHRGLFRAPGLEEFGHPRQTSGDVLGTGGFTRRLCQQGALPDLGPVFHFQISLLGHRIDRHGLALGVLDGQLGVQVAFVLNDLGSGGATTGIPFDLEGLALHEVLEVNDSFEFRDDRHGVRVPGAEHIASGDLLALSHL